MFVRTRGENFTATAVRRAHFVYDVRAFSTCCFGGWSPCLSRDDRLAEIDRHMQSSLAPVSSDIIKACLPGGQAKPFPQNSFSLMVLTGAKGSMVNHSQVSRSAVKDTRSLVKSLLLRASMYLLF